MSYPTHTPAPPSANEAFSGGDYRLRSLSFDGKRPPIEYTDLLVLQEPRTFQKYDDKGRPLFWDDNGGKVTDDTGRPIWEYSVQVRLPASVPDDDRIVEEYGEDDHVRYLYYSGSKKPERRTKMSALALAVRTAKAKGIYPGGVINRFAWVAGGEKSGMTSTPKEFEATYTPPPPGYKPTPPANAQFAGNGAQGGDPYANVPPPDDEPPF